MNQLPDTNNQGISDYLCLVDKECVFALDHPDICTIFLSVKPYMLEHDISVFYKVVWEYSRVSINIDSL